MAVYQTNVIDRLELEKETGHIVLTVIDDSNWVDEEAHIADLEAKLNTYLAFVESGDVFERLRDKLGHPVSHHSPIKFVIRARHPLSSLGQEFFNYARTMFSDSKVGLFFNLVAS